MRKSMLIAVSLLIIVIISSLIFLNSWDHGKYLKEAFENKQHKLPRLSYLVFNFYQRTEDGYTAFFDAGNLFKLFNALYKSARYYYWTKSNTLGSFATLAALAYFTSNKTYLRDAIFLWNYIKNSNFIYNKPILIKNETTKIFYRVPYLAKDSVSSNRCNIVGQIMGLYYLWKTTNNEMYLEDLRKSVYYKESFLDDNVNKTFFYGYYFNVVWHPLVNASNGHTCFPPYGTPALNIYWDGKAENRYNYWTWTSSLASALYMMVKTGIFPAKLYAKIYRDLFANILWDSEHNTIWEAWNPLTNETYSLFGSGNTRIHAYNLGPFIFASQYYPELCEYFNKLYSIMTKHWVQDRKMYAYRPSASSVFEQYMMTIPNALYQIVRLNDKNVTKRNIEAILTYLVVGATNKPVAWPNGKSLAGIIHAKEVFEEWHEKDDGTPPYVNLVRTFEGYQTSKYLLLVYNLSQLYVNPFTYSVVSNLSKFIRSDGYLAVQYTLGTGLGKPAATHLITYILPYYVLMHNVFYGNKWHESFRYNYRYFSFPVFVKKITNCSEQKIVFTILDIKLRKDSLIFIPFYKKGEKHPYMNILAVYLNKTMNMQSSIVFSDCVVAPVGRLPNKEYYISNLTLVFSNNKKYLLDKDMDLLQDYWEEQCGFSCSSNDTDNDGIFDYYEALYGEKYDPFEDEDGDGICIKDEQMFFVSPSSNDTDGDGLSDCFEIALNLNPLDIDSDNDGIIDSLEIKHGFNPLNRYSYSNSTEKRSDWYWFGIRGKNGTWSFLNETAYRLFTDYGNLSIKTLLKKCNNRVKTLYYAFDFKIIILHYLSHKFIDAFIVQFI